MVTKVVTVQTVTNYCDAFVTIIVTFLGKYHTIWFGICFLTLLNFETIFRKEVQKCSIFGNRQCVKEMCDRTMVNNEVTGPSSSPEHGHSPVNALATQAWLLHAGATARRRRLLILAAALLLVLVAAVTRTVRPQYIHVAWLNESE